MPHNVTRKYKKREGSAVWVRVINECLQKPLKKKTARKMRTVNFLQEINND
jgi:hypothetical protein